MSLETSRRIAGLLGPALTLAVTAELPAVQPHLYDLQTPPVVYLSGLLAFVAGLAILRAHNVWTWRWPVLITLTAWAMVALGVARMFFATAYTRATSGMTAQGFTVLEALLILLGLFFFCKQKTAYEINKPAS